MNSEAVGRNKACCASCGIAAVDDVKLKDCSACKLAKYCGVKCQKEHWQQHKQECKQKAAELRDEILFEQPWSSNLGDCPIFHLLFAIAHWSKIFHSHRMLLQSDLQRLCSCQPEARGTRSTDAKKCPFCRHVLPKSKQQVYKNYLAKRAEANDPAALYRLGMKRFREGNYPAAFEYYSKAHYELSVMYQGQGIDVDGKSLCITQKRQLLVDILSRGTT